MSSTQPTTPEGIAAENLARKQAAGRIGAALIMVPILLGLLILWTAIASMYMLSTELAFEGDMGWRLKEDVKRWMGGPVWAFIVVHALLLFFSWNAGRGAGVAVLHNQGSPWMRGIGSIYLATFPAMLLTLPVLIVITEGFDELAEMFDRHLDQGIQIGVYLALFALVPAVVLGLVNGFLLYRARKKNGKAYELIVSAAEPVIPDA